MKLTQKFFGSNSDFDFISSPSETISSYRRTVRSFAKHYSGTSRDTYSKSPVDGLVSVITVSLNSARTIARTIDSVAAQRYRPIEYIVIDGKSNDDTATILNAREHQLNLWISEPDRGISDAFNRGIALASGEYIAIVNSDDWIEPNHISDAVCQLRNSGCDFAFGDVEIHDEQGTPLYRIVGDPKYAKRIAHSMPALNHPSIVAHRRLYELHGLYDTSFRVAMDYEWLLRVHRRGARGVYVSSITSHMENTGISNKQILGSLQEVRRAAVLHSYSRFLALLLYHLRAIKLTSRILVEKYVSRSIASTIRSLVNPGYKLIRNSTRPQDGSNESNSDANTP